MKKGNVGSRLNFVVKCLGSYYFLNPDALSKVISFIKKKIKFREVVFVITYFSIFIRGVNDGWVEWAIARQGFGRIIFAHPVLVGYLHFCL